MTPFFKSSISRECTPDYLFGRIINYYRLSIGLTQIEFGEKVGLSQETIQRIETNKITYQKLIQSDKIPKIEKALSLQKGTLCRFHASLLHSTILPEKSNTKELFSFIETYKYHSRLCSSVILIKRNNFINNCIELLYKLDLSEGLRSDIDRWMRKIQRSHKNYKLYKKSRIDYYKHNSRIFIDFCTYRYVWETYVSSALKIKITKSLYTNDIKIHVFQPIN